MCLDVVTKRAGFLSKLTGWIPRTRYKILMEKGKTGQILGWLYDPEGKTPHIIGAGAYSLDKYYKAVNHTIYTEGDIPSSSMIEGPDIYTSGFHCLRSIKEGKRFWFWRKNRGTLFPGYRRVIYKVKVKDFICSGEQGATVEVWNRMKLVEKVKRL